MNYRPAILTVLGTIASVAALANPQFNAIDYATTGSTRIVIGPCDTRKP